MSVIVERVPDRALGQRMEGLRLANRTRSRRAELKRDLASGRLRVVDVLTDPPDFLLTAKVYDVLLAVPKYGRVKVNKALNRARMSPVKTVGGMSERQRGELLALLSRRRSA